MAGKSSHHELEEKIEDLEKKLAEKEANERKMAIYQKRLKSLWELAAMQANNFMEICNTLLESIVSMTESQYGFYGFIINNEKEMNIYSWSKAVMSDCIVHNKPLNYKIEESGIWGNAIRKRKTVIYNDYTLEIENKKGMPEGHVAIDRILSVPVFSAENKIIALGCVANKQEHYDNEDAIQLKAYLSNAQLILENRKTEEERSLLFDQALSELKVLRGILPLCSFCKKIRDDNGYWEEVDIYIHKYSQADISHSICPDCLEENYAKEYKDMMKDKKGK